MAVTDFSRAGWRRASRSSSSGGQRVEVAVTTDRVGVRDSKEPHGAVPAFDRSAFSSFLAAVRTGRL
ncbi:MULTISPECIES: DUF397 domain-containing protein [unclassified Actinopolyspora]|uniref:DUF397 domain-containing protein n=1 Tax=unclassified Actinopolyspora TaxID=2639451 RepID=UPI0013F5A7F5|nr:MULTISPECIES: DUF397 domain-containing protein [unclassified Actinopolyspora]NHD17525.1 DUF397 domain-containing protein [Actinopolyspora sp. BKK2]NHE76742.1 DUF397 domain-containing protein [Actinopolyspora sp. BKK1]